MTATVVNQLSGKVTQLSIIVAPTSTTKAHPIAPPTIAIKSLNFAQ